ncbi:Hypothetical_protein [Hexamita inflata]|uniref:Hypothetical_protein n=1 Tax=Hexamita inflata TaxID=28002 RepID=A0AA86TZ73_9EUKA|nr:Hypothetical protein HINF_LOCUS23190 [Hexamita inflata]
MTRIVQSLIFEFLYSSKVRCVVMNESRYLTNSNFLSILIVVYTIGLNILKIINKLYATLILNFNNIKLQYYFKEPCLIQNFTEVQILGYIMYHKRDKILKAVISRLSNIQYILRLNINILNIGQKYLICKFWRNKWAFQLSTPF